MTRWNRRYMVFFAGLAIAGLAGCGDGGGITVTEDEEVEGLRFVAQPGDVVPGEAFSVSVELVDGDGSRVTSATDEVTLSATGGVTLQGTLSVQAAQGLATFDDLRIDGPASNVRLSASGAGQFAQSEAFSVLEVCDVFQGTAAVGASRSGSLDESDCPLGRIFPSFEGWFTDRYELSLSSRRSVGIDMTSGAFDTFLFVIDAGNDVVAFNDDREGVGGTTDSRVSWTLPSGEYVVLTTSFFEGETGPYQLQVSEIDACEAVVGFIFLDSSRSDSLADGDCLDVPGRRLDYWALSLDEAATFDVTMESSAFQPFVGSDVVGGTHQLSGGTTEDEVTVEHVFSAGDYWLFATSSEAVQGAPPGGSYTLTTSAALPEPQVGCITTAVAGGAVASARISAADCETGEETPRNFDGYDIFLLEGETVSVTATADFEFQFQGEAGGDVLESLRDVPAGESRTIEVTAGAAAFHSFFIVPETAGVTGDYELSWSDLEGGASVSGGPRMAPSLDRSGGPLRPTLRNFEREGSE